MSQTFQFKAQSVLSHPGESPQKIVVMLHGYGANGADLLSLSTYWRDLGPVVEFIAPNAPYPCEAYPIGFQWYSLSDRNLDRMLPEANATLKMLKAYLDQVIDSRRLTWNDVVVMGFSQGGRMATMLGLSTLDSVAGILSYSGALYGADRIPICSRSPLCLIHGDADPIVDFEVSEHACITFKEQGLEADLYRCPGLDHGIDDLGIQIGFDFMKKCFGC